MANTRFVFTPESAAPLGTAYPELKKDDQDRFILAYDASTVEAACWVFRAPQGLTGTMQVVIDYAMETATSGKIDFEASIEAFADGEDLSSASFDTANAANETVPGTVKYRNQLTITLTNNDSMAAGELCRLKIERDADDGTDDTAAGDCWVYVVEFQDNV